MSNEKEDGFLYHYNCKRCQKPVRTNITDLNELQLCRKCGTKRALVERLLDDEGLMAIIEQMADQMMKEAGDKEDKDTTKAVAKEFVDYKCPKCGAEGKFTVVGAAGMNHAQHKALLSKLPMCPECMGVAGVVTKVPTPGMPKTEGPVGPTPVIKDPDEEQSHSE